MKRAAALAAVLSVVACSISASPAPRPSPPAARTIALGDIKIGALFPTSGPDAVAGADALHGVQLATEVLNGGHAEIGLPRMTVGSVVLDAADTGGTPDGGVAAADRLLGTDHVVALTGALESNVTGAVSERAEQMSVPMVSGSATDADLTDRGLRWFWRVGPSDRTFVQTAFAWLRAAHDQRPRDRPIDRAVVVHADDQADQDLATMVEKLAPSDVDITEDVRLPNGEPDWTPEVQRLGGYAPDVLFVVAPEAVAVRLLQTMAKAGYTPPALLGLGDAFTDPSFAATLGPLAEYVFARTAWSPEIGQRKPLAAAVAAAYRAEFGRDMTAAAARDFEATLTLGMAIEAADSTDPARIRSALAATDISTTIMGWQGIRFDGSGQNTLASGVIEQLAMGQYHVVYPTAVATAAVVWPMPALNRR